ncbi:hypothetical protein PR048_007709 [Dryococelus australis]|uniref:Uncharacterized protein n=1 Tax=Dryococelus australis TaxID=614101 RepID=A0ABQ9HV10_9NEOP|nr:hypothetical protein PR048_007709 [Dryococelus australis]
MAIKWTVEISATQDICASMEEFCGVLFPSSEQHVDISMTRIIRNTADIRKLAASFDNNPSFPIVTEIMSIATGVAGDCIIINCYEAVTFEKQAMGKIEGIPFSVSTICEAYIDYVKSHNRGRIFHVVFDEYTNSPNSTKAAEQEQWYQM